MEWVLDIEMKLREDRKPSTSSSQANPSKSSRDPNAMDIDAIKKVDKLSKEQEEWIGKGLCFRCGKHKVKRGEKCRYPKYKGFYELPPSSSPSTQKSTTVRTVEQSTEQDDKRERDEFIQMCLAQFEPKKGKGKETAMAAETVAARIEEITDEEDFLQRAL